MLDAGLLAPSFARALSYLTGHSDMERGDRLPSELNLDRTRFLLDALGRPDQRYPSILIAGTKGKGSTAAMIERGLRAAGYRTGLYTQPHLHTIRERVRLDGTPIEPEDFAEGLEHLRGIAESGGPSAGRFTAYELMTTMALERFARHDIDLAVIEVGLGGRLDATNAIDATVSVLTSISLDHTQILGHTLGAIAREKADIIKVGRPCVSAPQHLEAMEVISGMAATRAAPLLVAGRNGARWEQTPIGGWDLLVEENRLTQLHPSLKGGFQRINSAVAATALTAFANEASLRFDHGALRVAVEQTEWAGRFETASTAPPTVLDGAHNVESVQRLREALAEEYPGLQPIYVIGVPSDKDVAGIIHTLCAPAVSGAFGAAVAPPPTMVICTAARHPRATSPQALAALVGTAGIRALVVPDVFPALEAAARQFQPGNVIVATGSLHVVAEAREGLGLAEPSGEDAFNPWAAR